MEDLLREARVIAVVGCSDNPMRDSHRITDYLMRVGYTVYPVNPTIDSVLGVRSYPDVVSIPERVDIVNVFRRPSFVAAIVEDAITAGAGAVWLQLGVGEPEAEERAREAGLQVVSEHCIAVEHRALGIGRRQPDERAG